MLACTEAEPHADAVVKKHDCFFDYDALGGDDEFADEIGYNSAISACDKDQQDSANETGYNSTISTCEKDQQWSKSHCAAEKQCNVAEGTPVGPLKPKDMKGGSCGEEHHCAREDEEDREVQRGGVPAEHDYG